MRAGPAHKTEMVSQLLFGEWATVQEQEKYFVKIQCLHDGYEGWCQRSQLAFSDILPANGTSTQYVSEWTDKVTVNGVPANISMGSPVLAVEKLGIYEVQYMVSNPWQAAEAYPTPEAITARASAFLNTSYLWGGRSVFGIDCSGFTQLVYRFFNIPLLRDAYQQATQGEVIGFLQETKCGDLAFFDNEEGKITHVGILLNDHTIIHAAGKVRIDKIDNAGIVNADTGERTHKLRIMKRILSF
jgi:cell wall-associated NlpC family hydrolase